MWEEKGEGVSRGWYQMLSYRTEPTEQDGSEYHFIARFAWHSIEFNCLDLLSFKLEFWPEPYDSVALN